MNVEEKERQKSKKADGKECYKRCPSPPSSWMISQGVKGPNVWPETPFQSYQAAAKASYTCDATGYFRQKSMLFMLNNRIFACISPPHPLFGLRSWSDRPFLARWCTPFADVIIFLSLYLLSSFLPLHRAERCAFMVPILLSPESRFMRVRYDYETRTAAKGTENASNIIHESTENIHKERVHICLR